MKIYLSPRFWRTATGFLVGVVLTAVGMLLVMQTKTFDHSGFSMPLEALYIVLVVPVMGLVSLFQYLPHEGWYLQILNMLTVACIWLFHPALFAFIFFCMGEKQTKKIVIAEVIVAGCVAALGIVAMTLQQ